MLTKRIIPCLDIDRGRVVKGVSFVDIRDAGDPAELASLYDSEGADELVFLDITASAEDRGIMVDVVRQVSERVFIPLTVGGGMRSVQDALAMLEAGADKVSFNTAAVTNPQLVKDASEYFGSQCVVVAIDYRRIEGARPELAPINGDAALALDSESRWEVYTRGGRTPAGVDALRWAKRAEELGAGELLITSMNADGQQTGYDLDYTRRCSESVSIPVIASGGVGTLKHLYDGIALGKADAVLAASIFHFGQRSIRQAKHYLAARGVPVRPI